MRKHRCPGGVKVAGFPGMLEVSGSIPVSRLCFLLIIVVFTLCLPCHHFARYDVQFDRFCSFPLFPMFCDITTFLIILMLYRCKFIVI